MIGDQGSIPVGTAQEVQGINRQGNSYRDVVSRGAAPHIHRNRIGNYLSRVDGLLVALDRELKYRIGRSLSPRQHHG